MNRFIPPKSVEPAEPERAGARVEQTGVGDGVEGRPAVPGVPDAHEEVEHDHEGQARRAVRAPRGVGNGAVAQERAQRVAQHVDVALRLRVAAGVGRAPAVREVDEEARAQPGRVGVARLREHQDHDEVREGEDQPVTAQRELTIKHAIQSYGRLTRDSRAPCSPGPRGCSRRRGSWPPV